VGKLNIENNQPKNIFRRSFLGKVLAGMGITVTAGTIAETDTRDSDSKSQQRPVTPNTYHETDHIRAYYESVRKSD